jgi:PBP1b-binding outer membrane lipoprotein LpoB
MEDFMKKVAFVAVLLITALALMGCPSVTRPVSVTSNTIGSKTGTASGQIILGAFGDADASALTAARNAGITKISTVDTQVKSFLGLVVTYTTTVTGD